MVEAYWLIGKRIVEEEQQGKHRAEYGQEIIKNLSEELQSEFGRGFGERILRDFRQFYLTFKDTEFGTQCVPNLGWSHIRRIMRLSDKNAMKYYLAEAAANNWSVRTPDRNISTLYYQRLLSSQKKDLVTTFRLYRSGTGKSHHRPYSAVSSFIGKRVCLCVSATAYTDGNSGILY